MEVLVTGASGFIGSFLVEELVRRRHHVHCLVLPGDPLPWIENIPLDICYGDVCRIETLYQAIEGVDYIYHLAGVKTVWEVAAYFRVNYQGTKNVLEATLQRNRRLKRFVYVSSQAAAGPSPDGHPVTEKEVCRPLTSYGKSKRAAEEYLQARSHEIPITILRPSLVYGPRNLETALLFGLTKWRLIPVIRHHHQFLNLIHVRDVVRGIILAAEHERARGQVYFLTHQEPTTWQDLAHQTFQVLGKRGWTLPFPWTGVKLAAGMVKSVRKLRGQPYSLIDEKMHEILQTHWLCSGQKAERELGFEPRISLAEGIKETIAWYEGTKL